jgi:predicted kinase
VNIKENNIRQVKILVGLPGIGKTTYIKDHKKEFEGYTIIAVDDITEGRCAEKQKEFGRFFSTDEVRSKEEVSILAEFDSKIKAALEEGKNILIERPNVTLAKRSHLLKIIKSCKEYHYETTAIILSPPDEQKHIERLFRRAVLQGNFLSLNSVSRIPLEPIQDGEFDYIEYVGISVKKPLFWEYEKSPISLADAIKNAQDCGNGKWDR